MTNKELRDFLQGLNLRPQTLRSLDAVIDKAMQPLKEFSQQFEQNDQIVSYIPGLDKIKQLYLELTPDDISNLVRGLESIDSSIFSSKFNDQLNVVRRLEHIIGYDLDEPDEYLTEVAPVLMDARPYLDDAQNRECDKISAMISSLKTKGEKIAPQILKFVREVIMRVLSNILVDILTGDIHL